jgi:23S rRNA-/tRNA-specific pseudouridylate synthase
MSFRSDRLLDDVLKAAPELGLYDLVEAGLISMAKSPGNKNNKLTQEALRLAEYKLAYYATCIEDLKKVKEAVPIVITTEQVIPAPVAVPHKVIPSDEHVLIIEKPVKRRALPKTLYRSHKTQILYWIESEVLQEYPEVFYQVGRDQDEGDDYLPIYSAEDIPLCELAGE